MGSGSDTHTHIHSSRKEEHSGEWDGKLASAQDKAPSRGERGEPRGYYTDQRTPGPKLGGKNEYTNSKDTHRRNNFTRGIRNKETKEHIINSRNKNRNEHRKAYRRHRSEAPRGDWLRMATEARRLTTQPPKLASKGDYKKQNKDALTKSGTKRTNIIRDMNSTQMIPDRNTEPDTNKMKWKYGDTIQAASANVRGMRDPIKREETITNGKERNIYIYIYNVLTGDPIPDSCYEVRKGYSLVFSPTSTDREHRGVGFYYTSCMEKYRNYYRQISSNLIAMELNTHCNPIIITSAYIPHDNTNDDRIRQRTWEDLTNFINETPEAINTIILGDFNTNIHANKEEEEEHIGPHIWERNGFSEKQRTQHPCK